MLVTSLLLMAAVVTIPPPAETEETRLVIAATGGVGNPEWVHAGVHGRLGALGATLAVGTQGLAHGVTGAGRWFLPAPAAGGFVEAGATVVRLAPVSDQTPGDLFPLGFVALGWQWRLDRLLLEAAIGPPPTLLADMIAPPLAALNAGALPRFRLEAGYAF